MKTISGYSIYCTEEQTRKASGLGAKIETSIKNDINYLEDEEEGYFLIGNVAYIYPTAEQMLGWLEEQEIYITVTRSDDGFDVTYYYTLNERYGDYNYTSRKEATLAAIDEALNYLSNKKK